MAGLEIRRETIGAALDAAAQALASAAPGQRPLAVVADSNDRKEMLRRCKTRLVGAHVMPADQLLAGLGLADPDRWHPLATIDSHLSNRRIADDATLLARIYAHLRQTSFGRPMSLARMFRDVLAEMERHQPESVDLASLPEKHSPYRAEITTLHELWELLCGERHRRRQSNAQQLARQASGPVVSLAWQQPSPLLQAFLEAAAEGARVVRIDVELDERARALDRLWDPDASDAPQPPVAGPTLYHAGSLEEAAQATWAILAGWLKEPGARERKIGLVGCDRLLVRRLHSLCLQEGVLITDRSGWLASNLLVGNVMLALATSHKSRRDLVAGLLQPLAFSGAGGGKGGGGAWWRVPRDLYSKAEFSGAESVLQALADHGGRARPMPPSEWFGRLNEIVALEPLAEFFAGDPAGDKLRSLLCLLAEEFAILERQGERSLMGVNEMRKLLQDILCETTVRADEVDSRIQLVNPGRFSSQVFDRLLLVGANAGNMPRSSEGNLFNDTVRQALGLPSREQQLAEFRQATAHTLASHDRCAAVWHGAVGVSPYLELLDCPAYKPLPLPWEGEVSEDLVPDSHAASLRQFPERLAVGGCTDLMDCPYKFYAQRVLKLRKDAVDKTDRRDLYGSYVHYALSLFHERLAGYSAQELEARLDEISRQLVTDDEKWGGQWFMYWEWRHFIGDYCKEIRRLQAQPGFDGVERAEEKMSTTIQVGGREVALVGIIDRIDRYRGGKTAVIDVKTGDSQKMKKAREHLQLPLYLAMLGEDRRLVDQSEYWCLKIESWQVKIERIKPRDMDEEFVDGVIGAVTGVLDQAVANGRPMPANGADSVCRYCDFKGMCRKEHWKQAAAAAAPS